MEGEISKNEVMILAKYVPGMASRRNGLITNNMRTIAERSSIPASENVDCKVKQNNRQSVTAML
jgi:hypothetical protein